MIRWREEESLLPLPEWAELYAEAICARVKKDHRSADVVVREYLLKVLETVWQAGRRHGREEHQSELAEIMRERVENALGSLRTERGRCPHCMGRGCEACGDTGYFREPEV